VTIRKLNWQGQFKYSWRGEVLERTADHLVLGAMWEGPGEPQVGEVRFVQGDRFLEHYYVDRAYAVWQVERPDGAVKAWYCNIETPLQEEEPGVLAFRDLLLDVLVYPDGRYAILDRDEFEQARQQGLQSEDVRLAEEALAGVLAHLHAKDPPFTLSGDPRQIETS
jgi:predicted RNA-binding protein associated with RNAse of E/G family